MARLSKLALLVGILSAGVMAQSVAVSLDPSVTPFVSVLVPGTPEFDRALNALVPTSSMDSLRPLIPYSVIVRNVSTQNLRGIQVVFQRQQYGEPDQRPYSLLSWNLDADVPVVLKAGGDYFYSPFFPAARPIAQRRPLEIGGHSLPIPSVAAEIARERPMVVSVELVIDSQGTMIGPDRFGTFSRIVQEQNADMQLAAQLEAKAGVRSAQISILQDAAAVPAPKIVDPFRFDFHGVKLQQQAQRLLRQSEKSDKSIDFYIDRVRARLTIHK